MKQADFRDVPDELWERIKPLLPSSERVWKLQLL